MRRTKRGVDGHSAGAQQGRSSRCQAHREPPMRFSTIGIGPPEWSPVRPASPTDRRLRAQESVQSQRALFVTMRSAIFLPCSPRGFAACRVETCW